MSDKIKKPHRYRKNARSAELWQEAKKARNAARGKQYWIGESIAKGGYWAREL